MSDPLVSIIVPCFNAAPWLADTLNSALAQTYPRCEIIVVDDGSADESLAVARRFAGPSVRIIPTPNQGAGAARNVGLRAAGGDFLQFLDADDLLSRDKIEAQVRVLVSASPRLLATCAIRSFTDGLPPETGYFDSGLPYAADHDSPLKFLLRLYGAEGRGGMVQTSQWLIPRAVATAAGPWNEALSLDDDGEYFSRVVAASAGVRYVPVGEVLYRKHPGHGSLSGARRGSDRAFTSALAALEGKLAVLRRLGAQPADLRPFARHYTDWALAAYPAHPVIVRRCLDGARLLDPRHATPQLETPRGRLLQHLLGWRFARRLQLRHHP